MLDFFSFCLHLAPPVLSEDIDKHRRRFNMRMLVPGRPVKDATPPPVPAERPSYKEKFIPPELSMWDYFVAKVRSVRNASYKISVSSVLLTLACVSHRNDGVAFGLNHHSLDI